MHAALGRPAPGAPVSVLLHEIDVEADSTWSLCGGSSSRQAVLEATGPGPRAPSKAVFRIQFTLGRPTPRAPWRASPPPTAIAATLASLGAWGGPTPSASTAGATRPEDPREAPPRYNHCWGGRPWSPQNNPPQRGRSGGKRNWVRGWRAGAASLGAFGCEAKLPQKIFVWPEVSRKIFVWLPKIMLSPPRKSLCGRST